MNQTIEKLKEKFLPAEPELKFKYEICRVQCHHCQEDLGCTKWKDKIDDINDKVKKIQDLEKKRKKLEIDFKLVSEEAKRKEIEEKITKLNREIQTEAEKIANSRVKEITIKLRENPDNETIAHEFAHAFLIYHHCPKGHHGKENETENNTFLFHSLKEFFLREIEKLDQ